MKLRICCQSSYNNALEKLEKKWNLQRTPITDSIWDCKYLSKDTRQNFEYWIELTTLEQLFELQKDLYVEGGFNNELIINKWEIGDRTDGKYKKIEEGFGLKVYNDYME